MGCCSSSERALVLENVKATKLPTRALFVTGMHRNKTFHFTCEPRVFKANSSVVTVEYTRRRGSLLLGVTHAY